MALLLDQFGRPLESPGLRPERGALYTPSVRDRWSSYPSRNLGPAKLARILRNADQGYSAQQVELFRELEEKDAHVASQMQMRKQAVLRLEYDVHTDSEDPRAMKVAEFCREVLLGLEDLDDLLLELLDAIPQGWAMPELLWDTSSGQAVIAGFNRVPQERTCWDDQGVPRLATDTDPIKGVEIPPFKVVFHRHRVRSVSPHRAGVMRTVAWWWMFKSFAVKDWAAFSELFGMPLRVGKYDSGANKEDREALKQALLDLGVDGAAVISKSTEIEFVEAAARTAGKTVFEAFASYCNREMSKAVLGQTLTSDVDRMGSYAAAKVHDNVREDLRDADAYNLAKTIRQQMLMPLALFNFGPDAPVPWFMFNIEEPEDLKEKSAVYKTLAEMGLPIPVGHVYETFKVPQPEGDEAVLQTPGRAEVVPNSALALQVNTAQDRARRAAQQAVERLGDEATRRAAIRMADLVRPLVGAAAEASDYDGLLEAALHAFPDLDTRPVANVLAQAVLAGELNGRVSAALASARGKSHANAVEARIRALGGPSGQNMRRINAAGFTFLDMPVDPLDAIHFFGERAPVTPDLFERLVADAQARAFTVAGVMQEDLLAGLYGAVDRALREGTTFAEFKAATAELFASRGLTGPRPWHLETVFRNNIQSSYMAGRYRQMVEPEVLGQRPFWQYETVGDAQVRPEHAAQHGKIYPASHPFWGVWYPPNGHNCRCDVRSLSSVEVQSRGLAVQRSMPPEQPDEGFRYNVGEAGWGRGLAEAALGVEWPKGPWRFRPDLLKGGTPAPATPAAAPLPADLPAAPSELFDQLGTQAAVKSFYQKHALEANGFGLDSAGNPLDLPLADARGDRVVLAVRTVDHVMQAGDLDRARYLGLARTVVEGADEVWLVPGAYNDGRITMRRYYHKFFEDGPDSVMVVAEFSRGVWANWNMLPLRAAEAQKRRVGLLLHPLRGLP